MRRRVQAVLQVGSRTIRGGGASRGASTATKRPMSETPLLQLRGITKTFGSVEALTDVDFEVNPGEVMALVGDNGAGKST